MIFIFANVWFFDDLFNLYEFQEKQNIEYQLGRRAKSEDFHDDLRGSQGRNIEYQQGRRATVNVFHVIYGVTISLKSLQNQRYFNDFHIWKCMVF